VQRARRLAGALLFVATSARAASRDPAAAEALFRDGRAAMQRGDYEVACAKLDESQRLDPAPGTLLNLAECEEKRGRLASAWQDYQWAAEALPAGDERVPYAKSHADALAPRLPRLVVRLASSAPEGSRVRRDDVDLGAASLGASLPVDPGKHAVVVTAPGRAARTYEVTAAEGRASEVTVDAGPPEARAPSAETRGLGKLPGWIGIGVGGGALVLGSVTGVLAIGRARVADEHCDAAHTCDDVGLAANSDGRTFSTVSTVAFVAGALLVAGGIAWVLTH
jgi:hypothetical protein